MEKNDESYKLIKIICDIDLKITELHIDLVKLQVEVARLKGFEESHGRAWQWSALCLFAFAVGGLLTIAISQISKVTG